MKKTGALIVSGLAALLPFASPAAGDVIEVHGELDFPSEWLVFAPFEEDAPLPPEETVASLPAELALACETRVGRLVAAVNSQCDLRAFLGDPPSGRGRVAWVFVPLAVDTARTVTLGFGGHWRVGVWLNGRQLLAETEGPFPPSSRDHLVEARLEAGRNVLAVRLVGGTGGAVLALGGPDQLRAGNFNSILTDPFLVVRALPAAARGEAGAWLAPGLRVAPGDKPAADIGTRRELFVDDFLVDRLAGGAARRMHQPAPREVVHVFDRRWEGNTSAYLELIRDGDRILLYYNATPEGPGGQTTALLVSDDGVNFTRPELGLFDYRGSSANNLLPIRARFGAAGHNFTPFLDANPAASPDQRFKAVAYHPNGGGLGAYASADGLDWHRLAEERVIVHPGGGFDSQNLAFWDPNLGRYVAYYRHEDPRGRLRGIWRQVSDDFIRWTDPQPVTYEDERLEHMYTNGIQPYFRAPHIYLGLPNRIVINRKKIAAHPHIGVNDVVLMSSRDGLRFQRWGEAFIRSGPEPECWTERNNYPAWGMLELTPGELSLYWVEHYRHPGFRIRRGTLRTDGFASLHAGGEVGELLTRPLVFAGDRLVINYATSAAGTLRFELCGENGEPLPGFALEDSELLYGNELEHIVTWRGRADLGALRGRPVRLRVRLQDADLYALRFASAGELRAEYGALAAEAAGLRDRAGAGFPQRQLAALEEARRELDELLARDGVPGPGATAAAARLARALARCREDERAAARVRDARAAADELVRAEEGMVGFGRAYRDAVRWLRDETVATLADENTAPSRLQELTDRLRGALADARAAADARVAAEEAHASAGAAGEASAEGFGLLFQELVARRRDELGAVLADPAAAASALARAAADLASAVAGCREVAAFPPVTPVRAAGAPAVYSLGGPAGRAADLLVNARADGTDLVPAGEPALRFAGVGNHVVFLADDALRTPAVTVEAWVLVEDAYLGYIPLVMLGRRPGEEKSWTEHAWNLWAQRDDQLEFTLGGPDGTQLRTGRGVRLEPGRWQHLAAQFDGKVARLFIDGEVMREVTHEGEIDFTCSEALRIGSGIVSYPGFIGRIRDLRVWDRARGAAEIRAAMHEPPPSGTPGLVGRWLAGESPGTGRAVPEHQQTIKALEHRVYRAEPPGAGGTVFDLSGGEHHGEIAGAAWDRPRGYALAGPVAFPDIASVRASVVRWRATAEGEPGLAGLEVLVGWSGGDDRLPDEWQPAVSGGPVPGLAPGDDPRGRRLWLKTVFTGSEPGARVCLHELTVTVE